MSTVAIQRLDLSRLGLPTHVLDLLEHEGVTDLAAWRRLGRKRHQLFGITKAMCRQIDAMAREVRE